MPDFSTAKKYHFNMENSLYRQLDGASKTDAVAHNCLLKFYRDLENGETLERAATICLERWQKFAKDRNKNLGGKTKSGPMAGNFTAHYKWADPKKLSGFITFTSSNLRGAGYNDGEIKNAMGIWKG